LRGEGGLDGIVRWMPYINFITLSNIMCKTELSRGNNYELTPEVW